MKDHFPEIDVMIYGHDGRGLGHVSRSAAIGMALRRIYPDLRVCLLTGCGVTGELVAGAPLDWLKLPGYRTTVIDGRSVGIHGHSGFSDHDLGVIRGELIRRYIEYFRPRLVLADHSPQGKHKELVPALEESASGQTRWLLGVRSVVGDVRQAGSDLAVELFKKYYSGLFWYGDSRVVGSRQKQQLGSMFGIKVHECGYVCRSSEYYRLAKCGEDGNSHDCIISVPWAGEHTQRFLEMLAGAMVEAGINHEKCVLFLGRDVPSRLSDLFAGFGTRIEPFGSRYLGALRKSKTAVIFGGYNSLVDVPAAGIPALVVARDMQDREQQLHLKALREAAGALWVVEENGVTESTIARQLGSALTATGTEKNIEVNLDGSSEAAWAIGAILGRKR